MPTNRPDQRGIPTRARTVLTEAGRAGVRAVFGDAVGVTIFLGALVFFGLYWRVGFFITDNWTIANTLASVADGHLYVDRLPFGLAGGNTPGMHYVEGRLYGRNYGHVIAAVPVLWALETLASVGDPRIGLAAVWSLALLGVAVTVARHLDRPGVTIAGAGVALLVFAVNVAAATPLSPRWFPVIALQLVTMTAAALTGVVLYRVITVLHGRTIGAFAGSVIVLTSPIAFWASIPKRHAITGFLAAVALFALVASRDSPAHGLRYRALGYVAIGVTAWVHAAEALVLLAVFLPVDLVVNPADRRRVAVLGVVLLVSLVPFAATNAAISGNPLAPPRVTTTYAGQEPVQLESNGGGGSGAAGPTPSVATPADPGRSTTDGAPTDPGSTDRGTGPPTGPASPSPLRILFGILTGLTARVAGVATLLATLAGRGAVSAPVRLDTFERFLTRGVAIVLDDPSRMYHTFVRSGWLAESQRFGEGAINLTLLESLPILGALAAIPVATAGRVRGALHHLHRRPAGVADVFAAGYVVVFVLLYINRLPLNAQVTVRYLVPIVPFGVYAVARTLPIRRVVAARWDVAVWSYAALVLIGSQLLFLVARSMNLTAGEAMQLHALVGVAVAATVAVWAVIDAAIGLDDRVGAVVVAVAGAAGTWFLLATGLDYFVYGEFVLAIPRLVSEAIAIV